jgi:hypothetical protein
MGQINVNRLKKLPINVTTLNILTMLITIDSFSFITG